MRMAPTDFDNPKALLDAVGTTFGPTDWVVIDQDRVDKFADATDDHQWIHVDVERAKAGPFGGTIAHGFLTMSMSARFSAELVRVHNISMGINYGVNKARFITPVKVPGRVRAIGELTEATEVPGGVQTVVKLTIELEGADKPAAVIEAVSRYLS
jgi:acyl dehydratase